MRCAFSRVFTITWNTATAAVAAAASNYFQCWCYSNERVYWVYFGTSFLSSSVMFLNSCVRRNAVRCLFIVSLTLIAERHKRRYTFGIQTDTNSQHEILVEFLLILFVSKIGEVHNWHSQFAHSMCQFSLYVTPCIRSIYNKTIKNCGVVSV